jgi:hypothetical protein
MNLQKLMTLAMDEKWENSRMKAIRFNLIGIPGIVAEPAPENSWLFATNFSK